MSRILIVTGTNTGVGKTIVAAALATHAKANGQKVVVVKPVQTGIETDLPDADVVHQLSGAEVQEYVGLAAAMAPVAAAELENFRLPDVAEHADRIQVLTNFYDLVIVEGAGGLLVRLDQSGHTLLDLAAKLGAEVEFVVVTGLNLGTLNHTELTTSRIKAAGFAQISLIIGDLPEKLTQVAVSNLTELPKITGCKISAAIPENSGTLAPTEFQNQAKTWFHQPE